MEPFHGGGVGGGVWFGDRRHGWQQQLPLTCSPATCSTPLLPPTYHLLLPPPPLPHHHPTLPHHHLPARLPPHLPLPPASMPLSTTLLQHGSNTCHLPLSLSRVNISPACASLCWQHIPPSHHDSCALLPLPGITCRWTKQRHACLLRAYMAWLRSSRQPSVFTTVS